MRCEGLFISGAASWLPEAVSVQDAVAAGKYEASVHAEQCFESITVAGDDSPPPVMAVRAGRCALERSRRRPEEISLALHASSWYQGLDFWPAAAYVHRHGGFARLRNVVSRSDTFLEVLYRGDEPFGPASGSAGQPADIRKRRLEARAAHGQPVLKERIANGLHVAITRILKESELGLSDVARIILPNIGFSSLKYYASLLGVELSRTQWAWGRRVGHLGAADQLAGFTHLVETGAVGPGDRVLLVGIGAGFVWTCAMVELMDRPTWAAGH
ncbi:MAG: 3-oxoacyl-[acyl-carrier-protein] synthase III C-terminal domain-containing protein [Archangium sp.]